MKRYGTIVIDPPWPYNRTWGSAPKEHRPNDRDRPMPYKQMTIEAIKALPVGGMAEDNCELYLWVTQKFLPDSFEIIKSWGFKYCQTLVWAKAPMGTGQGGVYCPTNEFLILARRGKMPDVKRVNSTWFLTKRPHNSHSTKPEFFQDMIEKVTQGPRLEMFARRRRDGWDVWGNEVDSDINIKPGEQAMRYFN